jgi:hypothetical protein
VRAQLAAVQKIFWILLICSAVVAAAAAPLGNNGRLMKVLRELSGFRDGFDRDKLEAFLFERATAQGEVALDEIAKRANQERKRLLTLSESASPIVPLAGVKLGTLAAVHAFCGAKASTEIGSPLPPAVADSLVWRLPKQVDGAGYELTKIELLPASVEEADVELEQKVVAARESARERKKAYLKAKRLHERADARFVMLRKRRAHWRPMLKAQEKRDEALAEREARKAEMDQADAAYEKLARRADKFEPPGVAEKASAPLLPRAAAVVTLGQPGREEPLRIAFPVSLEVRSVPVPPLAGCDFAATKAAGIWKDVAGLDAEKAIGRVEARFSWHYSGAGKAFLQVAPVALLGLLGFIFLRIRKAAASYNPFDKTSEHADLPRVGLKPAQLNLLVIVVLPLLGCVLCVWSLMQIDVIPAAPIFCALLVLGLGALGYARMNELSSLRDAVTRSHRASQAPPGS